MRFALIDNIKVEAEPGLRGAVPDALSLLFQKPELKGFGIGHTLTASRATVGGNRKPSGTVPGKITSRYNGRKSFFAMNKPVRNTWQMSAPNMV
jgi:hypothetical protein